MLWRQLIRPGSLPDLHVKNVRGGRDGHPFLFFFFLGFGRIPFRAFSGRKSEFLVAHAVAAFPSVLCQRFKMSR